MKKAVLFDMNGVLVDSEGINIFAWQELFKEYDLEFSLMLYKNQIDGKATKEVALDYQIAEVDRFIERKDEIWFRLYAERGIKLFDDVMDNLKKLKKNGVLLGVTSSSRKTDIVLKDLNLKRYFDVIVNSEMVNRGKPFPDIYIEAMRRLKILPDETVVIEDSDSGVRAATSANIVCYKICRYGEVVNKSMNCIESLYEIWNEG